MKVCRTCEHSIIASGQVKCTRILNTMFTIYVPEKQSCTEHKERVKTKKVTLRRALLMHNTGEVMLSGFTSNDMSVLHSFIRWHDSIEIEVPVEE